MWTLAVQNSDELNYILFTCFSFQELAALLLRIFFQDFPAP